MTTPDRIERTRIERDEARARAEERERAVQAFAADLGEAGRLCGMRDDEYPLKAVQRVTHERNQLYADLIIARQDVGVARAKLEKVMAAVSRAEEKLDHGLNHPFVRNEHERLNLLHEAAEDAMRCMRSALSLAGVPEKKGETT